MLLDAAHWDAAVNLALQSLEGSSLLGRRFAEWRFYTIDESLPATAGNAILMAVDPAVMRGGAVFEEFDFGFTQIEDFAYWLDDASWLDAFPYAPLAISDRVHILELLQLAGDVGHLERYNQFRNGRPPGILLVPPLLLALSVLRRAWRISQAIQKQDLATVADLLESSPRAPGSVAPPATHVLDAARRWMVGTLVTFDFVPGLTDIEEPHRHFYPASRPTSPIQLVMLTIAVGAGAVEAALPALQVCDYKPCARIFVANRSGSRGSYRFCSPRCGKRFHATKHTYAKRAAERAEKQRTTEEQ